MTLWTPDDDVMGRVAYDESIRDAIHACLPFNGTIHRVTIGDEGIVGRAGNGIGKDYRIGIVMAKRYSLTGRSLYES